MLDRLALLALADVPPSRIIASKDLKDFVDLEMVFVLRKISAAKLIVQKCDVETGDLAIRMRGSVDIVARLGMVDELLA